MVREDIWLLCTDTGVCRGPRCNALEHTTEGRFFRLPLSHAPLACGKPSAKQAPTFKELATHRYNLHALVSALPLRARFGKVYNVLWDDNELLPDGTTHGGCFKYEGFPAGSKKCPTWSFGHGLLFGLGFTVVVAIISVSSFCLLCAFFHCFYPSRRKTNVY